MAVNNTLVKSQQKLGISDYLTKDAIKTRINNVIGGKNGTRFISSIVSAVNVNPQLQECTNQSILAAALLGETLNLSPSPQLGLYYMVPFQNKAKGTTEATFVLGYKGYIQMAIRSGQYKKLNVISIKEGELVRFDPLTEDIEVKLAFLARSAMVVQPAYSSVRPGRSQEAAASETSIPIFGAFSIAASKV